MRRSGLTRADAGLMSLIGGITITAASPFIRHRLTRTFCLTFAASMAGAFLLLVASAIASEGVCCADDGIYAMMAKNLAGGLGFSTTLQPDNTGYKVLPFDPQAGGPAVVVPAAALIKILGNQYWVPGLAAAFLWLSCFCACAFLLRTHLDGAPAGMAAGIFTGFIFALFPYHFEQWYALLGEVPASGLILVAVIAWSLKPKAPGRLAVVGMVLGLAVLSKALAFLWVGVVIAAAGVDAWRNRKGRRRWWNGPLLIGLGVAVPVVLFELWKLAALGWDGYREVQRDALAFLASRGVTHVTGVGVLGRTLANSTAFRDRFALPVWLVLLAASLAWGIVWLRASPGVSPDRFGVDRRPRPARDVVADDLRWAAPLHGDRVGARRFPDLPPDRHSEKRSGDVERRRGCLPAFGSDVEPACVSSEQNQNWPL